MISYPETSSIDLLMLSLLDCSPPYSLFSEEGCKTKEKLEFYLVLWKKETPGLKIVTQGSQIRQIWHIYAKINQMTPQRLRRESLRLQKFLVTNREPLRLQKFLVTNTALSLPFLQQIQFTLIVNVVNLN